MNYGPSSAVHICLLTCLRIIARRENFVLALRFRWGAAEALADRRQSARAQADFHLQFILDRIRGAAGHVPLTKSQ